MENKNSGEISLIKIQTELKSPKKNFNSFGKYKYRSCEDILTSLKPLLKLHNSLLILKDDLITINNLLFTKSIATFKSNDFTIESIGFAQISEHKGMSPEQACGTASSYARKYALNGLFLIDETEQDPDSFKQPIPQQISKEKPILILGTSNFDYCKEAIKNKGIKIEQIKAKYSLSVQVEQELLKP